MNTREQFEKRIRETKTPKQLFFMKIVKRKFHDLPGMYGSFLSILFGYEFGRIDLDVMYQQVSDLFLPHPVMIRGFCNSFLQLMFTKDDDVETTRPAKKAKIEDHSSKAVTAFDPTSGESTSHTSNYSQTGCCSGCYPLKSEAVVSCRSSSPFRPVNAAEAYEAQKKEMAQLRGRIVYVAESKTKFMCEPQAYQHLIELVNIMEAFRFDTYDIMKYASKLFGGYPELIENFNIFLPDGFKIVVLSDDHEINTD